MLTSFLLYDVFLAGQICVKLGSPWVTPSSWRAGGMRAMSVVSDRTIHIATGGERMKIGQNNSHPGCQWGAESKEKGTMFDLGSDSVALGKNLLDFDGLY